MKSIYHGMGYYLNDDRASGGHLSEDDLMGCGHCQAPVKKSEWREDGCWCGCCGEPIGVTCGCADRMLTHGCENFKMRVERQVERDYVRAQNARML